jgi:hypothetical protein
MAFKPGVSGNPGGRPKSAAGLRELLEDKYGDDASVLVGRLEKISTGRTPRLALEATKLLLSYHCGTPAQAIDVSGVLQHGRFEAITADAMSRLTTAQLDALAQLNGTESPGAADDVDPA